MMNNTVPCKWCGEPTRMLGTRMCNFCWEMHWRIRRRPDIAKEIIRSIELADIGSLNHDSEAAAGYPHEDH